MKERLGELKEELYGERRAGKEALREVRRCGETAKELVENVDRSDGETRGES